jgi:uncharacterized protein
MVPFELQTPPDEGLWAEYERAFRSLLWRVRAERLQLGVDLLVDKARRRMELGVAASDALQGVYDRARSQTLRQLIRRRAAARCAAGGSTTPSASRRMQQVRELLEAGTPPGPVRDAPDFHCDAALGGLARWLRGIGYRAAWWPGVDDGELVDKVFGSTAILVTTDRPLMRRGLIRWGAVPAVLIPHSLKKRQQLACIVAKLQLPRKPPLCMGCGGPLRPVEKKSVRDRIPPRTYPWRDEYYVCQDCVKLFWKGTHWERIEAVLDDVGAAREGGKPLRNPRPQAWPEGQPEG